MPRITEALITEHAVFGTVFDHIEHALPKVRTGAEAKMLAALVEALLRSHSETETDLAYAALDHALDHRGELDQLHQDHQEIDARLQRIQSATGCGEARRLLKAVLRAAREHFAREEKTVFPLIDRALSQEMLADLGNAWAERNLTQRHAQARASRTV